MLRSYEGIHSYIGPKDLEVERNRGEECRLATLKRGRIHRKRHENASINRSVGLGMWTLRAMVLGKSRMYNKSTN